MIPEARTDQVLAENVGDELVVYDERTCAAHHLNRTAALVWRLANGRRSVGEIATALHRALDVPDDEDFVHLALAELNKAGLLTHPMPAAGEPMTRRQLFGVAAAVLPLVASIVAPTPAMAASLFSCDTTTRWFSAAGSLSGSCGSNLAPKGSMSFSCNNATNTFSLDIWDDVNERVRIPYQGTINPATGAFSGTRVGGTCTVTGTVFANSISVTENVDSCTYSWTGTRHVSADTGRLRQP